MKDQKKARPQTKATPQKKAPLQPETIRQLNKRTRVLLNRIGAISTNGPCLRDGKWEAFRERLIGAEQTLNEILNQPNYLNEWLANMEGAIREIHKTIRTDCGCGVCKAATPVPLPARSAATTRTKER